MVRGLQKQCSHASDMQRVQGFQIWVVVNSMSRYQEYQEYQGYQEYQENQDQISGATYISDVAFLIENI